MDFLRKKFKSVFVLGLIISLSGCAKFDYLYEQSLGQISLLSRARDNRELLKSVRVPRAQKEKIIRIAELKTYFYRYWGKKETRIYSQTTMLKNKAVTYLVIASPFNEVRAVDTCFPVMGCFPYLGFFNLSSAKRFAKEQERSGNVTWIRPVYAYSTLGYFTDTILSSFFNYDDYELAELIFHELFHTIFFITNQVDLNENLANYFSENMLKEYFSSIHQEEFYLLQQKDEADHKKLKSLVVFLVTELQEHYKSLLPKTAAEANLILRDFLENRFRVEIMKRCQELNVGPKSCFPLNREWNNASFAAFLTYEKKSNDLYSLQKKLGLDLKAYYTFIEKKYQDFEKGNGNKDEVKDFEIFLFR